MITTMMTMTTMCVVMMGMAEMEAIPTKKAEIINLEEALVDLLAVVLEIIYRGIGVLKETTWSIDTPSMKTCS